MIPTLLSLSYRKNPVLQFTRFEKRKCPQPLGVRNSLVPSRAVFGWEDYVAFSFQVFLREMWKDVYKIVGFSEICDGSIIGILSSCFKVNVGQEWFFGEGKTES